MMCFGMWLSVMYVFGCQQVIYSIVQVRSLADSDEVFESACDLNEVMVISVFSVYSVFQNLLDEESDMEDGELLSEVSVSSVFIV